MRVHHPASPQRSTGLARTHSIVVVAVAVVVVVLSITRLQLFAVYENERDAVTLLEYLGDQLRVPAAAPVDGRFDLRSEVARAEVHVGNPADSQWLDGGRVLRRRGYLYDFVAVPNGGWCLRAWPWRAGTTGVAAYAYSREEGLLGHHNRALDEGAATSTEALWSGPDSPPRGPFGETTNWERLEDVRRLGLALRGE